MLWDIPQMVTSVTGIINKFVPDRDAQAKIQAELSVKLMDMEATMSQAQTQINAVEASSSNFFVSGWRPCVGWVCALAFAWQFVGQPLFSFFYALITHEAAPVVALNHDALNNVLFGILGLGAYRSWEKIKGITK
jgi:roadblock/LC7 domain-containing protein